MKRRRSYPTLLATAALVGLMGYGLYRLSGASERQALNIQLVRASRMGLPADMTGLWPAPKDPTRNAAPIYASFWPGPNPFGDLDALLRKKETPNGAKMDAELAKVAPKLASIEAASELPECRFQRTPVYNTVLPEYSVMRSGVRALVARAGRESYKGDPAQAMRSLAAAARVSAQLHQEPLLVAKFVQVEMEADVLRGVESVLGEYGQRSEVRNDARAVLKSFGPLPDVKAGLRGEWAWHRQVARDFEAGRLPPDELAQMVGVGDLDRARLRFLFQMRTPSGRLSQETTAARIFLDMLAATPNDPTDIAGFRRAVDAQESEAARVWPHLANVQTQFLAEAPDFGAEAVVRRRLMTALLNALDAKTPPASIPIAAETAIDPFDGKPLRYRTDGDTIRIWSVGPNGKDENGRSTADEKSPDIAIYWPLNKAEHR